MEFMSVNEHIAGQKRADMVKQVCDRLGSLWVERGWSRVQNRDLYAGIVHEFQWHVLRSEYIEALRRMEKDGIVSLEGTEDRNFTTFH
jgi:hypothetical protein